MGNVGLLLVGVVLFVNGLAVLGVVAPRGAAPLNLFVGAAQVVLPTIILAQSGGDPDIINATWPSYLFGFTYLFYGLIVIFDLEPEGMGWFSSFVAAVALFHAVTTVGTDPVFAVIWLTWAIMWALFFALMALGKTGLSRFTGWFLVLLGVPTCTVSGVALLRDQWSTTPTAGWLALGGLVAATLWSVVLAKSRIARPTVEAPAVTLADDDVPLLAQSGAGHAGNGAAGRDDAPEREPALA